MKSRRIGPVGTRMGDHLKRRQSKKKFKQYRARSAVGWVTAEMTHRRKSSFIRTCYAKALAPFILYDFGLDAGTA